MNEEKQEPQIARFYTRSRKFPRLIGRFRDGTKIPGGPYTLTQGVVAAILLALGLATRGLWGLGSIFIDVPVVLLAAWGGAWGAGHLPPTRRNVASVLFGALGAAFSPAAGKYKEQQVRLSPPHFAGGTATISFGQAPIVTTPPQAAVTPTAAHHTPASTLVDETPTLAVDELVSAGHAPSRAPVTGVERLLAQARGSKKE